MKKMNINTQKNTNGGCKIVCECGVKFTSRIVHGIHLSWSSTNCTMSSVEWCGKYTGFGKRKKKKYHF